MTLNFWNIGLKKPTKKIIKSPAATEVEIERASEMRACRAKLNRPLRLNFPGMPFRLLATLPCWRKARSKARNIWSLRNNLNTARWKSKHFSRYFWWNLFQSEKGTKALLHTRIILFTCVNWHCATIFHLAQCTSKRGLKEELSLVHVKSACNYIQLSNSIMYTGNLVVMAIA